MACAPKLAEKIGDVDVIITAEAKGMPWPMKSADFLAKKFYCCKKKHQILYERRGFRVGTFHYDIRRQHLYLDGHDAECLRENGYVSWTMSSLPANHSMHCRRWWKVQRNRHEKKALYSQREMRQSGMTLSFCRNCHCFRNLKTVNMRSRSHKENHSE